MDPACEWLAARLKKGPAVPQEVRDEATLLSITTEELDEACRLLGVQSVSRVPVAGGPAYEVWQLPATFDPQKIPTRSVVGSAKGSVVGPTKGATTRPNPKARVAAAKARLQRHATRHVRYLEEIAQYASRDPEPCPTCKRGMPRAEETRLRAILAALDKAGMANAKDGEGGEAGPAIIFPPGTRIAVLAE